MTTAPDLQTHTSINVAMYLQNNAHILLLWSGLQPGLRAGFEQKKLGDQAADQVGLMEFGHKQLTITRKVFTLKVPDPNP